MIADTSVTSETDKKTLALIFLRLGLTAFGGPAAHVALMRQEFVERRHWLTEGEFLDLLGASSLIPGPSSTELAIHLGRRQAGGWGLVLAGVCFILPAAALVIGFAWAYAHFGHLPRAEGILRGVEAVIVAVVAHAIWSLGRSAWKTPLLTVLGLLNIALAAVGVGPLPLLFGTGVLTGGERWWTTGQPGGYCPPALLFGIGAAFILLPTLLTHGLRPHLSFSLVGLFLVFLRTGATVFGSGYVLLAFLRDDLVTHLHWLTSRQLLDAVAVGQVTPGPVFTTATFIGYLKAGIPGALTATVAMFLPGFLFVAASAPLLPRLRRSPIAGSFLDGVNASAVSLMAVVAAQLARAALTDWATALMMAASLFALLRLRVNSLWLLLAGAALGLLVPRLGQMGGFT